MRRLSLIGILCLVSLASGCLAAAGLTVGAAAGVVGYVYYDRNEAQRDFPASFDKTWNATLAAMKDLKYAVPKEPQHFADSGDLTIDDVSINVVSQPGTMTRVSIRVGTFDTDGHRRRAGLIFEKIQGALAAARS
jgi:hypothetical protein